MIKLFKRSSKIDTEEMTLQAKESLEEVRAQQPKVNYINRWLENRKRENGLGEDFEVSVTPRLRPRGAE